MGKLKYEAVDITRAIGGSGLAEELVRLDKEYTRITGVRAFTRVDGGEPYYDIGLKDREVTYHNLTDSMDWQPSDIHYKLLNIRNRGQDFYISTSLPQAVVGSDMKIQLVFRLESDE